jgi:bacteriorhodopsin
MQTVWLILGTLIMGLSTAYFVYRGTQVQVAQYFYWITAAITGVAFISFLDVLAKVGFGFLLLSNQQTLQELGGGEGAQASRVR